MEGLVFVEIEGWKKKRRKEFEGWYKTRIVSII